MVKPKVSQKAPKEPKTTNGKVLPMIHCGQLAFSLLCMDVVDEISSIAHLADRTKNHEDATKAEVRSDCSGTVAAGATPAHKSAR
jgi:hypothetical protein